jgi:Zn-finger protein
MSNHFSADFLMDDQMEEKKKWMHYSKQKKGCNVQQIWVCMLLHSKNKMDKIMKKYASESSVFRL